MRVVKADSRYHVATATNPMLLYKSVSYYPALEYSKKGWQWLSCTSSVHYGTSEQNWRECCVNLSNSSCGSARTWRISMPPCGCSIQISGPRISVLSSHESATPGSVPASACG